MDVAEATRRVMAALDLTPDADESAKQQLAISQVLQAIADEEPGTARVKELEAQSQRRERYVRELASQVRTFNHALLGGGFPPPWWVTATHALDEMQRLTAGEEHVG